MSEYPRYLIFGTLENEQFESDAWKWGWFSQPTIFELTKQKLCKHNFTLWCTNKGIKDVHEMQIRFCKKCSKQESIHKWV